MPEQIKKVAVIGAGVMGAGIAALIANSGHYVVLLDVAVKTSPNDKNALLKKALERISTQKPLPLAHINKLKFITTGNLEDDLGLLKTCDLIIEAITEKIDLKKELYNKIFPYLKKDAILASNTSTLKLFLLKENLPSGLKHRFLITHFFNPPRFMDLVEIITDFDNDNGKTKKAIAFIENILGKTVVKCNDTPGFIANRVGCFLLELVVRKSIKEKLDPATVDNIFIDIFHFPKTAIFGLYDLIGLDVMKLISNSLLKELPGDDAYHAIFLECPLIDLMIKQGLIGRKAQSGFYNGKSSVISLESSNEIKYRNIQAEEKFKDLKSLLQGNSKYSKFFNAILKEFYKYLFSLIPTVTDNAKDIDTAMRLGYGWTYGPFELLAREAAKVVTGDEQVKIPSLFNNNESKNFEGKIIFDKEAAGLTENTNALLFKIKTKLGILNNDLFNLLSESIDIAESKGRNLIIYSNENYFSAGADLKLIRTLAAEKKFKNIDDFLSLGQKVLNRLKTAKVNIISCANGIALGGGAEILMHSDYIIAHRNLNAGLVEVKAGLSPGFGGIKEAFAGAGGNKKYLLGNLKNILSFNKSTSADYFIQDYGLKKAKVLMNKKSVLKKALDLKLQSKKPIKHNRLLKIPYINLEKEIDCSKFNETQKYLIKSFQSIIEQKEIYEEEILNLERKYFLELSKNPAILI